MKDYSIQKGNTTINIAVVPANVLGGKGHKTRTRNQRAKHTPDPTWKRGVAKQADKAVLVEHANRVYAVCYCPHCPEREHYQAWIIVKVNDPTKRTFYRRYLCEDWGDREIVQGQLIVLRDTGKRGGKRAIYKVDV